MSARSIDPASLPEPVLDLAHRVHAHGGRALVVGGWVRDALLGLEPKDLDVEVHGLEAGALDALLGEIGRTREVGRSFAIRRVSGLDADVSWVEPAHTTNVSSDDGLDQSFAAAAKRRDLTVNAMGFDPIAQRVLDPTSGRADIETRTLRATNPARFGDDAVRAMRVAQLSARLDMRPDDALVELCRAQPLGDVAGERLMLEWTSLLLRAKRPSIGIEWLRTMDQLDVFPEIDALRGVPQDARWHPEGDVYVHTLMSLDAAATLRPAYAEPLALMFGVLCHDFGKPMTTTEEADEASPHGRRIRSIRHERAGLAPARRFLKRLHASNRLIAQVEALVDRHLAPAQFAGQNAGDKAHRRLVRRLDRAHVPPRLLADVARADHLGRTTEDAMAGRFDAGDAFLARLEALGIADGPRPAAVQGRHLVERGYVPGPEYGALLERCLEMQDATGIEEAERLLERVIGENAAASEERSAD